MNGRRYATDGVSRSDRGPGEVPSLCLSCNPGSSHAGIQIDQSLLSFLLNSEAPSNPLKVSEGFGAILAQSCGDNVRRSHSGNALTTDVSPPLIYAFRVRFVVLVTLDIMALVKSSSSSTATTTRPIGWFQFLPWLVIYPGYAYGPLLMP